MVRVAPLREPLKVQRCAEIPGVQDLHSLEWMLRMSQVSGIALRPAQTRRSCSRAPSCPVSAGPFPWEVPLSHYGRTPARALRECRRSLYRSGIRHLVWLNDWAYTELRSFFPDEWKASKISRASVELFAADRAPIESD